MSKVFFFLEESSSLCKQLLYRLCGMSEQSQTPEQRQEESAKQRDAADEIREKVDFLHESANGKLWVSSGNCSSLLIGSVNAFVKYWILIELFLKHYKIFCTNHIIPGFNATHGTFFSISSTCSDNNNWSPNWKLSHNWIDKTNLSIQISDLVPLSCN